MVARHHKNKEPDYLVHADFKSEFGTSFEGVYCEVWLPEYGRNDPELILRPTSEEFERIRSLIQSLGREVTGFHARTIADANGNHRIIESDRIFIRHHSYKWAGEMHDQTVYLEPFDLRIIEERGAETGSKTQSTHLTFWVTENEFFHPAVIQGSSYEGTIDIERGHEKAFDLGDGTRITFDNHYTWTAPDEKTYVRKGYLVARMEMGVPAINWQHVMERILPRLDELLLVATFATRNVTVCVGWDAVDKDHFLRFYRANYRFPEKPKRWGVNPDGIVLRGKTEELIRHCYGRLTESLYREAIQNTVHSVVPHSPPVLEQQFLSLFASIEEILIVYKDDAAKIVSGSRFKKVRKAVIEALDTLDWLTAENKEKMKDKILELNRPSLRSFYEDFCRSIDLDVGHLWPVFSNDDLIDLTEIRNRLIHGDPFPRELGDCLQAAWLHLQWTVQRVLCRLLDWPMGDLESEPEILERMATPAFTEMQEYRQRLTGANKK